MNFQSPKKISDNTDRILRTNAFIHSALDEEHIHGNYGRAHYNSKYPFTKEWHVMKQTADWSCQMPAMTEEMKRKEANLMTVLYNNFSLQFFISV